MEEFDLSYDSYINICKICIDFSADQGGIACMKVADFSHLVSTEINLTITYLKTNLFSLKMLHQKFRNIVSFILIGIIEFFKCLRDLG